MSLVSHYEHSDDCVCRGVSPKSEVRVEIQMTSGDLSSAQNQPVTEVIDLQALFNDFWSSNKHYFTVLSQSLSPTSLLVSDGKAQRTLMSFESITSIVGL